MGATVKIASLERMRAFKRDGGHHPPLDENQLDFADTEDKVTGFFFNDGNITYSLEHSPGEWHEELLNAMDLYALLPDSIEKALSKVQPSWDGTLAYYPCKVVLKDGTVFDNVYIQPEHAWVDHWGYYPEKPREFSIEDVGEVGDSPMRLPAQFATELYLHGESGGMGYTIFAVVFADGHRQAWGGGNAVDFIRYPAEKGPDDVMQVIPHEGRRDPNITTRPDYYVCLYAGAPAGQMMTVEAVRALVRVQSAGNLRAVNHGITLNEALVEPRAISVIDRQVKNARMKDRDLSVWLVGQEKGPEGYRIILSEDGSWFGLASSGKHDKSPVLVGWYGDLLNTFLGM
jgi:hypothetical protein